MEKRRKIYIPIISVTCFDTHDTPFQNLEEFITFLHNTNREAYTRLIVSLLTRFNISPREAFSKVSQTSAKNMCKEIVEYIHSHLESEETIYPLYAFDSLAACNEYLKLYSPLTKYIKYFELYISGYDTIYVGGIDERSGLYLTNKDIMNRVDCNVIQLKKIDDTGLWEFSRVDYTNALVEKLDVFVETDKESK